MSYQDKPIPHAANNDWGWRRSQDYDSAVNCGRIAIRHGQEEHDELITYLATHPLAGDEIVGTGGVRKVRFAAKGKGKSGGVRVIYYFYDREMPIYALLIYGKNERADLTPDQRRSVASFAAAIKSARRRK